jgi:hypothetical protein
MAEIDGFHYAYQEIIELLYIFLLFRAHFGPEACVMALISVRVALRSYS